MNIQSNIQTRSCNNSYGGKAIIITYCECVFVTLGIQRLMRMRHNVFRGLPRSKIFFLRYLIKVMIFEEKKGGGTQNMCFDFL